MTSRMPGPANTIGRGSAFKSSDPTLIQQEGIVCARGNKTCNLDFLEKSLMTNQRKTGQTGFYTILIALKGKRKPQKLVL